MPKKKVKIPEGDITKIQALLNQGQTLEAIRAAHPELGPVIDHVQFEDRPRPGGSSAQVRHAAPPVD